MGGVDPGNQAFVGNMIQLFDRMGGNIQAMLGLGAQADTAAQEQLIHNASSRKESQMQNKVFDGLRSVVRDLGLMLWDDQFKTIPALMEVPGTSGFQVESNWTPEDREGNFIDYNFDIDIFSMVYQTPGQRIRTISQVLNNIFIPLSPFITQQGGTIDVAELANIYSEMTNEPRIKHVVRFDQPSPADVGPQTELPTKPNRS